MYRIIKLFLVGVLFSPVFATFIPIEGTFIQAWMYARWDEPNYVGEKDAWDKEVLYWKSLGINQVIDGDIAYKNPGESNWRACYSSKLDSVVVECHDKDIIMEKAKKYGFKVYLGMGVDNDWWSWDLLKDSDFYKFKAAMMKAGAFARELYDIYNSKYPENFGGFYSVYEVWNHNHFNDGDSIRDLYAKRLADGFNIVIDSLNLIDSKKPLLFSQFATDDPNSRDVLEGGPSGFGTLDNTEKFWTKFLEIAKFRKQDKMLPMDAVGGGGQRVETVEAWTKAYANAVKNSKSPIGYYANIESFAQPPYHFLYDTERTPLYGQNYSVSAPIGRFVRQIAVAERNTKGIFNFAFSHYHSPINAIPGYYNVLLNYLKTGKGDDLPPKLPDSVFIIDTIAKNGPLSDKLNQVIMDKVFKFYWKGSSDDNGIHKVSLNRIVKKENSPYDSVFAYAVSTRTESGTIAHEPDSIYFAYSTGRECIGLDKPEEEDCFNPRFTGTDEYSFVVTDVWGNESVSKPFILESTGSRTFFIPELDSVRLYVIDEKDSLRSYFAIDSAWVKDEPKPQILSLNPKVTRNGLRIIHENNHYYLDYKSKFEGLHYVEIFAPNGIRIARFSENLKIGNNIVELPNNDLGYGMFYIKVYKHR